MIFATAAPRWEVLNGVDSIRLTAQQFAIFSVLNDADGEFVSAEDLLRSVTPAGKVRGTTFDSVKVQITYIRRKLAGIACIENVRGVGYRLSRATVSSTVC